MIVHKFGGGILKTPESVKQLVRILRDSPRPSLVVVSALNKMTNALERVVRAWRDGLDPESEMQLIRGFHYDLACRIFSNPDRSFDRYLKPLFVSLGSLLSSNPPDSYDEAYDRVVSYGEMLSTALLRTYFEEVGLECACWDARELVVTDENYRDAGVLWKKTVEKVKGKRKKEKGEALVLTQGFIGRSEKCNTVTLGREGSDFSAAIFAYCLDAEEVWIWKDVPGILTADPAEFSNPDKMDELSYLEVIELAYYGAKVIHPKTIKPLQNKSIPLWVRDFWHPEGSGTRISNLKTQPAMGPVYIRKIDQVLISFQPRDFSFIVEGTISEIFAQLASHRIKVNLMQHSAVSLTICVTADMDRINSLIQNMLPSFRILYNSNLELLTIRHYTRESIKRITRGRRILVQQLSRKTARFVLG